MKRRIEKAVVLGAGTMGARIAAHFANAGLPCVLLDVAPAGAAPGSSDRNKIVRAGLEAAKKSKPAAFFNACVRCFLDDDRSVPGVKSSGEFRNFWPSAEALEDRPADRNSGGSRTLAARPGEPSHLVVCLSLNEWLLPGRDREPDRIPWWLN